MSLITSVVSDTLPTQASDTPPATSGLTAVALARGVLFHWSLSSWIRPYTWEYRTQVAAEGWSSWTSTLFPIVLRTLTAAELASAGATANVQIQVRSTNGLGDYGATGATNTNCLVVGVGSSDITDLAVAVGDLAAAVTARMFSDSTKTGADLLAASVALSKLAADATLRMFNNDTRTAADVTAVNGVAAATVSAGAASGTLAQAKLVTDGVQSGGATIESTTGSQAKVDARLSATEKANLQTALGVALASLDVTAPVDLIVIAQGTNKNIVALATSIKTDLSLNNVDNKSSATIRGEITEANLQAAGGVTNGAATNLAAAINTLSGVITKATMLDVAAEKIEDNATGTALFDTNGNLTFGAIAGVGIKSGATVIEPADLILAVHTDGTSKNLDLTKLKAGQSLDSLADGATYSKTTANEKTGAGRAYSALNSSNELTTGTTNKTVAEIEAYVHDHRSLRSEDVFDITAPAYAVYAPAAAGIGTEVDFHLFMMQRQSGDNYLKIRFAASSQDALGIVGAEMLTEAEVAFGTPVKDEEVMSDAGYPLYTNAELSLAYPSGVAVGDWVAVRMYIEETIAQTINVKKIRKWNSNT